MPHTDDAAQLAAEVRDRLPGEGYVHIARTLAEEVFTSAAKQLGTIELRTDIRVDSEADDALRRARDPIYADRPSVYRPVSTCWLGTALRRTPSTVPRR